MSLNDTPLMQQWREIKSRHQDALVFFRVGDFYEMFFEDAEEGARLLGVTLTSRNNGSSRAPLAGIPVHALDGYLQRLIRLGRRVAICEQVEDPSEARGIVRREVVETVSPGTALADSLLDERRNNFLVALSGDAVAGGKLGVAWADLSTGEVRVQGVAWESLTDTLGQLEPSELLLPRSWELLPIDAPEPAVRTFRSDWQFETEQGQDQIKRRYGVINLEGFGFTGSDGALIAAAGALIAYLGETQPLVARTLRPPRILRSGEVMQLDEMTRRNLEIVEPLGGRTSGETLLRVVDEALTPMGGRLLRRWLLTPLVELSAIARRHDAVAELVESPDLRRDARAALAPMRDVERLAIKVASGRCTPRELLTVAASLHLVPRLTQALGNVSSSLLLEIGTRLDSLPELRSLIASALSDEVPPTLAEGGVIRPGFDAELDELRELRDGAVQWIAQLQARERERSGINSLKIGFNRVFGYYLEVTRANVDRVPADYIRKQTLANAERYMTPELKEWEEKILGAEEKILALEARLFDGLRRTAAAEMPRLQTVSEQIALVDVLAGLAEVAVRRDYVRPTLDEGYGLEIRAGRHPVVERMMPTDDFIPNDAHLHEDARVMILTGPNMAGKSTVLRQVGLICLLAQIGSFVPARAARLGLVDRIFTRVGASDNLVRGQSTFMVEMNETAAILNGATSRSLVLLDEIGRGTSTWDGISVASAVTEFLHQRIGAKTIFATHYHELTRLADRLDGIVNFSVAVKEEGDNIVFLRALVPGGADRSYGVEVARLAGLPIEVIERARRILQELEFPATPSGRGRDRAAGPDLAQLALFAPPPHVVVERLRELEPDHLTPMQALNMLAELAKLARA
ncbi:DNA mismatch repair protein MutS [soil metagenome]